VHTLVLVLDVAGREILLKRKPAHYVFGVSGTHLHLNAKSGLVRKGLLDHELLFASRRGLALHKTHIVFHHHGATADEHGHHFEFTWSRIAE